MSFFRIIVEPFLTATCIENPPLIKSILIEKFICIVMTFFADNQYLMKSCPITGRRRWY